MSKYTMPDKFQMEREMSVFVAKKYLKESVYRSAHLEGMAVTFPQTEVIIDNIAVSGVSPKDISKVCDLRDAWKYVLDNLDTTVDLKFLADLQEIIAREDVPWNELGKLREVSVRITGTNYIPPRPKPEQIHDDLQAILDDKAETDRAVEAGLYVMRMQPFLDGNKRVGTMVTNRLLVGAGRGIFSVPDKKATEFSEKLTKFYETGDSSDIKRFIFDFCLTGVEQV